MKPIPLIATLAVLAACAQSPTAPSTQSDARPNLATVRAARNPSGTGQPTASCEVSLTHPNGFSTAGFAHAETVYAGGVNSHSNPDNPHAVSQYDVACYQLSNK